MPWQTIYPVREGDEAEGDRKGRPYERRTRDCNHTAPMAGVLVFAEHSVDDRAGNFQYPFAPLHLGEA